MTRRTFFNQINKIYLFFFTFLFSLGFLFIFSFKSYAAGPVTVKVGYYSSHNFQEGSGDQEYKSGYSYEYLQKVASYTGWCYEYVYGSWADLYQQLLSGDIASYSGKKIGTLSNHPRMTSVLERWITENNADVQVIHYTDINSCAEAFNNKEIDAFVSADNIVSSYSGITPIEKIGKEPYYLCVTNKRQDLLDELNRALSIIDEQDAIDLDELHNKYSAESSVSIFLSKQESDWMAAHDTITVGYTNHYLPYGWL